jgi:hypothetical protein
MENHGIGMETSHLSDPSMGKIFSAKLLMDSFFLGLTSRQVFDKGGCLTIRVLVTQCPVVKSAKNTLDKLNSKPQYFFRTSSPTKTSLMKKLLGECVSV